MGHLWRWEARDECSVGPGSRRCGRSPMRRRCRCRSSSSTSLQMRSRCRRRLRLGDVWQGLRPSWFAGLLKPKQAVQSPVEVDDSDAQSAYEGARYWTEVQLEIAAIGILPLQRGRSRTSGCSLDFQASDSM